MKDMILVVTAVFPPEPVVSANISYDIAKELSKDNNVTVFSPMPSRPFGKSFSCNQGSIKKSNFDHIISNSYTFPDSKLIGRLKESYSFGKATSKLLYHKKDEIKLIYANTWPLFAQYFLIKTAKKLNIPVVLHIQDIYPESIVKKTHSTIGFFIYHMLLPLDRYILKNSRRIIGISNNMISYLSRSRKINESRFTLIRNWQNDTSFEKGTGRTDRSIFNFVYLGSISPSAGVEVLILAFNKAKIKNCRLTIAGTGSDKEKCVSLAAKLGNCDIEFLEAEQDKVPYIQSQANVLLLPLRKGISLTATPSKLTAYMFSGRPILASIENGSDAANCIIDAGCGFISDPEDINLLAENMERISKMKIEELNEMGNRARKYAEENLSKKVNLEGIVSLIKSINEN